MAKRTKRHYVEVESEDLDYVQFVGKSGYTQQDPAVGQGVRPCSHESGGSRPVQYTNEQPTNEQPL